MNEPTLEERMAAARYQEMQALARVIKAALLMIVRFLEQKYGV